MIVSESLEIYINTKITNVSDFTIKTYSVKPTNKSGKVIKYGSDDNTYMLFPELLEKIPRGYSELFVNKSTPLITLKGFKKFDGTTNKTYKPFQVGQLISNENITTFEEKDHFTLQSVYLPSW